MLAVFLRPLVISLVLGINLVSVAIEPHNYISKIHCALLGKHEASSVYQAITYEALAAFGIVDLENVPVKRLDKVSKRIINGEAISFAKQGIWINEEKLKEYPFEEAVFMLYYEVANYAYRHHDKEALLLFPAAALFYSIPLLTINLISNLYQWTRLGYIFAASLAMIGVIDLILLRPVVRRFKQKAEQEAVRVLCHIGKQHIVKAHVDYLQSLIDGDKQTVGSRQVALSDRIRYVSACLQELAIE